MELTTKNELTEGWKCYFIEHKETREWWAAQNKLNNVQHKKLIYESR